jgi:hypothetical protein
MLKERLRIRIHNDNHLKFILEMLECEGYKWADGSAPTKDETMRNGAPIGTINIRENKELTRCSTISTNNNCKDCWTRTNCDIQKIEVINI